jgi:hypothetical protein
MKLYIHRHSHITPVCVCVSVDGTDGQLWCIFMYEYIYIYIHTPGKRETGRAVQTGPSPRAVKHRWVRIIWSCSIAKKSSFFIWPAGEKKKPRISYLRAPLNQQDQILRVRSIIYTASRFEDAMISFLSLINQFILVNKISLINNNNPPPHTQK